MAKRQRPTQKRRAAAERAAGPRPASRASARTQSAPPTRPRRRAVATRGELTVSEVSELRELRRHLERVAAQPPPRWNADPDEVQQSVAKLVLTLVEFVRRLLERQAIRRMEGGTLTARQTEDVGRALMQLEETVHDIAARFGVAADELNLDLGPVGRLM